MIDRLQWRAPICVAALALCLVVAGPVSAQQAADSIWFGGPILTMNDQAMRAEAVAEAGGKIIAVGRRSDIMKLNGPATQLVDLKGRTLVPGFVDAHGHIVVGGLQALSANLLAPPDGKVQDIASLQQTLRDWAQKNAAAVEKTKLIVGFGYDNSQLKELRHPTKEELDAVSQEIPILIVHQSSHLATANSAMLKAMGYDANSKDPAGGVIQRKPGTTEPNGTLEETAFFNGAPVVLGRVGPEGLKTFAREGARLWARYGYTTADEGRATPQVVSLLRQVAAEGGFANDVNAYPDALIDRDFIKANQSPTFTQRFRVAGAKLTIDGSPQGFTAWRDRPYYKPVGNYPAGYSGYAAASAEDVMGTVQWAAENGIQIITHSNGERASDLLIAAHRAAQARFPKGNEQRNVLIHGWKLSPIDMASLDKWHDYTRAKEAMFVHCDTSDAPWTVIKSDCKKRARLNAMRYLLTRLPYSNKDLATIGPVDPLIVGRPSLVPSVGGDDQLDNANNG